MHITSESVLESFEPIYQHLGHCLASIQKDRKFSREEALSIGFINRITNGLAATIDLFFNYSNQDALVVLRSIFEASLLHSYLICFPEQVENYTIVEKEIAEINALKLCIEFGTESPEKLTDYIQTLHPKTLTTLNIGIESTDISKINIRRKIKDYHYQSVFSSGTRMLNKLSDANFLFYKDQKTTLFAEYHHCSKAVHNNCANIYSHIYSKVDSKNLIEQFQHIGRSALYLSCNTAKLMEYQFDTKVCTYDFSKVISQFAKSVKLDYGQWSEIHSLFEDETDES